jgi:hypothetical protein
MKLPDQSTGRCQSRHEFRFSHADVSTAMIYTRMLQKGSFGVVSPLDRLCFGPIHSLDFQIV